MSVDAAATGRYPNKTLGVWILWEVVRRSDVMEHFGSELAWCEIKYSLSSVAELDIG